MQKRDVSVNSCPWQPDGNGQLPGRRNGTAAAVLPLQLPPGTSAPECGAALFCVRPRAPTGCPPCGASSRLPLQPRLRCVAPVSRWHCCLSDMGSQAAASASLRFSLYRPDPMLLCPRPRAQRWACNVGSQCTGLCVREGQPVRVVTFSAWSGGEAFHQSRYSRATRLCTLPPSWHSSAFCV